MHYLQSDVAVPGLLEVLKDKDSEVSIEAVVNALVKIKSDMAVPGLLKILRDKDEDSGVRHNAMYALVRINSNLAVPGLLEVLSDKDSEVRANAAHALGKFKSNRVMPGLLKAIEDESSNVRRHAVYGLGNVGSDKAVDRLLKALEEDSEVYTSVVYFLDKIASPRSLPKLQEQLLETGYLRLLDTIAKIQGKCQFYRYYPDDEPQTAIELVAPKPTATMQILHLSDIHITTPDQANLWSSQLADDLREQSITHLDALILSGDIANYATEAEYTAAQQFLTQFRQDFPLDSASIIVVPGNHDLNWQLSKKAYSLRDRDDCQDQLTPDNHIPVSDDVVRLRNNEKYPARFQPFSDFYQTLKARPYPTDPTQQYTLDRPSQDILILGLNSAWHLDHHYKTRVSINDQALTNALNEIRRTPDYANCSIKIAVWHHPTHSAGQDRITDDSFLERLTINGFRFFLHGHIHQAQKSFYDYDGDRGLFRICAGTFGAPAHELVTANPWQYHLLTFEDNQLTINSRKRASETGAWESDYCWRQGNGKSDRYTIQLNLPQKDTPVSSQRSPQPGATSQFDVFLAHNSQDKPLIRQLHSQLTSRGIRPWLDVDDMAVGTLFQDGIQQAITQIKSAAICIGQNGLGRWQKLELKALVTQCVERNIPVIPVLLPGVTDIPSDLPFLREFHGVTFPSITDQKALDALQRGIENANPQ